MKKLEGKDYGKAVGYQKAPGCRRCGMAVQFQAGKFRWEGGPLYIQWKCGPCGSITITKEETK